MVRDLTGRVGGRGREDAKIPPPPSRSPSSASSGLRPAPPPYRSPRADARVLAPPPGAASCAKHGGEWGTNKNTGGLNCHRRRGVRTCVPPSLSLSLSPLPLPFPSGRGRGEDGCEGEGGIQGACGGVHKTAGRVRWSLYAQWRWKAALGERMRGGEGMPQPGDTPRATRTRKGERGRVAAGRGDAALQEGLAARGGRRGPNRAPAAPRVPPQGEKGGVSETSSCCLRRRRGSVACARDGELLREQGEPVRGADGRARERGEGDSPPLPPLLSPLLPGEAQAAQTQPVEETACCQQSRAEAERRGLAGSRGGMRWVQASRVPSSRGAAASGRGREREISRRRVRSARPSRWGCSGEREEGVCARTSRRREKGVVHERRRRAQGRAATEGPRGPRRSPRGGRAREEGRAGARGGRTARHGQATWLILPVVICSAQRLSHACLGIRAPARNCERLITTVVIRMALSALVG